MEITMFNKIFFPKSSVRRFSRYRYCSLTEKSELDRLIPNLSLLKIIDLNNAYVHVGNSLTKGLFDTFHLAFL